MITQNQRVSEKAVFQLNERKHLGENLHPFLMQQTETY